MRLFIFISLFPLTSLASFSKPELLARFMFTDAWNVPDNTWCWGGEPAAQAGLAYLNCLDQKGGLVLRFNGKNSDVVARAEDEQLFSKPQSSLGRVTWYEFNEHTSVRSFVASPEISKIDLKNLGTLEFNDSFLPFTGDTFFFKTKGEEPKLWLWKNDKITEFFAPKAAYIFSPVIGADSEIAVKTRSFSLDESSPDQLWRYERGWKIILKDTDADPSSPWKSFRHGLAIEGGKVLVIATDASGEALLLIDGDHATIIAREGRELARFDHFSPKMRNGIIVVRGEDFQGRKVTYVFDENGFRPLLTQGDIVHTDRGLGRVDYENRDALFYGAPGLDEKGNIYLQSTLTDADHPKTLLGIGLIKFNKE